MVIDIDTIVVPNSNEEVASTEETTVENNNATETVVDADENFENLFSELEAETEAATEKPKEEKVVETPIVVAEVEKQEEELSEEDKEYLAALKDPLTKKSLAILKKIKEGGESDLMGKIKSHLENDPSKLSNEELLDKYLTSLGLTEEEKEIDKEIWDSKSPSEKLAFLAPFKKQLAENHAKELSFLDELKAFEPTSETNVEDNKAEQERVSKAYETEISSLVGKKINGIDYSEEKIAELDKFIGESKIIVLGADGKIDVKKTIETSAKVFDFETAAKEYAKKALKAYVKQRANIDGSGRGAYHRTTSNSDILEVTKAHLNRK